MKEGVGESSVVKITGCCFQGPRFNSQHPLGGFQPFVTPVLGDVMAFCTRFTAVHAGKTHIHLKVIYNNKII